MQRALPGLRAEHRIGLAARDQVGDHDLLVRDDHEEHVRDHDRADQRAGVDVGAAAGEHPRVAPGGGDQESKAERAQQGGIGAKGRPAQPVVDHPAERQRSHADQDRAPDRQVHDRRVNQIEVGAEIIDQAEQHEAAEPGGVGLVLEPGEVLGQLGGGDQVLLHPVEAAAVHLPGFAADAGRQAARPAQAGVEMDEVKGRADPCDAGDQMDPAHDQADPVRDHRLPHGRVHRAGRLSRRCGQAGAAMTAGPERSARGHVGSEPSMPCT